MLPNPVQPHSEGEVRLASADPLEPPVISLNYLDDPHDVTVMVSVMRRALELVETEMLIPGDRDHQISGAAEGLDHHLDPGGQLLHGVGMLVDQVQVQPGQERVVLGEPAVNASVKAGSCSAVVVGQVGELSRVPLPGDQRLQHCPARDPGDVGGDRGQLDPGVLEQLLQPLDLPGPLAHARGAGPGQVPPDRLGWHERAADQSVRPELRQPRPSDAADRSGWDALGERTCNGLGTASDTQSGVRVLQVLACRLRGDVQAVADRAVGLAQCRQAQHLQLTVRQVGACCPANGAIQMRLEQLQHQSVVVAVVPAHLADEQQPPPVAGSARQRHDGFGLDRCLPEDLDVHRRPPPRPARMHVVLHHHDIPLVGALNRRAEG
jgi:hypothetical protein